MPNSDNEKWCQVCLHTYTCPVCGEPVTIGCSEPSKLFKTLNEEEGRRCLVCAREETF